MSNFATRLIAGHESKIKEIAARLMEGFEKTFISENGMTIPNESKYFACYLTKQITNNTRGFYVVLTYQTVEKKTFVGNSFRLETEDPIFEDEVPLLPEVISYLTKTEGIVNVGNNFFGFPNKPGL